MIKKKIVVNEAPKNSKYNFVPTLELTDFFKQKLTQKLTLQDIEDIIQFNVGIELNRTFLKFDESVINGGLCSNQIPNEIASLLYLIYSNKYKIDSYLEVGVNKGGTFYLIDSFLRAFNKDYQGGVAVDKKNVLLNQQEYFKKYPTTKIIVADSKRLSIPKKFDMILIDGDHTYNGVKADYENFKNSSDFICFHDTNILHKSTNVKKLWDELKVAHPNNTQEFLNKSPLFNCTLGIGVLLMSTPKIMS